MWDLAATLLRSSMEIGDRGGEGADLINLGYSYADLGEVEKAIDYTEQARNHLQELKNG